MLRTMKLSLIPCVGLLVALAGCPGDDSGGDDDGANDSGSTTATTMPTTTTPQTSGPEDSSGTSVADSGSATDSGTSATDSGATDSGATSSSGTDSGSGSGSSGGEGLCADAVPIVGLAAALGWDDVDDFPEPPPIGGGDTSTNGGGPPPPSDDMRLVLANYGLTCKDPYGSGECKAFDKWRLVIDIPLAMQQVGVYDLADFDVFYSEVTAGNPPDCAGSSGTGGGGMGGTLIIDSIGPNGVTGCIEDAQFLSEANGAFDTTTCLPM